jgi:DNA polymerase III alpha subunit (gram-positive type)
MPILKKPLLVFDTETTGLTLHPSAETRKQPKMIEFGAVSLSREDGRVLGEVSQLINPGEPLTEEITRITGLTDADLKGMPSFWDFSIALQALFMTHSSMAAHNLPFDRQIIQGELDRLGMKDFVWPEKGTCTVGLYRDIYGHNVKLTKLYEDIMGRPLAQTHRALDDVQAMVEVIQKEELWRLM